MEINFGEPRIPYFSTTTTSPKVRARKAFRKSISVDNFIDLNVVIDHLLFKYHTPREKKCHLNTAKINFSFNYENNLTPLWKLDIDK